MLHIIYSSYIYFIKKISHTTKRCKFFCFVCFLVVPPLAQTTVNSTICRWQPTVCGVKSADLTTHHHKTVMRLALSGQMSPSNHYYLLSGVLSLSTRPHSSQADRDLSYLIQWRHCAPLTPQIMTFVVPVQPLVIGESQSAQLLFPPQSFLSATKPGTQSSLFHTYKEESEQHTGSLDHRLIPPPKICYQAEEIHGIRFCLHTTNKEIKDALSWCCHKIYFNLTYFPKNVLWTFSMLAL